MKTFAIFVLLVASCSDLSGLDPTDAGGTGGASIAATVPATGGASASSTATATGGVAVTGGMAATGGMVATGGTTATLPRDAGKSDLPPETCTADMDGKVIACAVWLDQTPPIVKCPWNMDCPLSMCFAGGNSPTPGVMCSAGGPSCACTR
jgi:hypothetical protein